MPQELLFRAFLLHRYAPVFRARWVAATSAIAFSFAHGRCYSRWPAAGSSPAASSAPVAKSLHAMLAFTIGPGDLTAPFDQALAAARGP
jgi:membrane protease YdiL (CAAX protease family)